MELPMQPKDREFDSEANYCAALRAWERVCMAIIAEVKRTESKEPK